MRLNVHILWCCHKWTLKIESLMHAAFQKSDELDKINVFSRDLVVSSLRLPLTSTRHLALARLWISRRAELLAESRDLDRQASLITVDWSKIWCAADEWCDAGLASVVLYAHTV